MPSACLLRTPLQLGPAGRVLRASGRRNAVSCGCRHRVSGRATARVVPRPLGASGPRDAQDSVSAPMPGWRLQTHQRPAHRRSSRPPGERGRRPSRRRAPRGRGALVRACNAVHIRAGPARRQVAPRWKGRPLGCQRQRHRQTCTALPRSHGRFLVSPTRRGPRRPQRLRLWCRAPLAPWHIPPQPHPCCLLGVAPPQHASVRTSPTRS